MPMELDCRELKSRVRQYMGAARPAFWLVTLVFLLLTTGVSTAADLSGATVFSLPLSGGDTLPLFLFLLIELYTTVMSFGYKHGVPTEADWVLDVRFIPNPYYVASLKRLTGNNKKVAQYVMRQDITQEFANRLQEIIIRLVPCYIKEGKYSLTIAFGCTGGQHRSVTLANEFYKRFSQSGWRVTLEHRDL